MVALFLLLFFPQVQADGLHPGEALIELAPVNRAEQAADDALAYFHGRVIDAFTGRPIADATIETWTEEITEETDGLRRIGEANSRVSGQFRVRVREGDLMSQKARVLAPGYAALSTVPELLDRSVMLFHVDAVIPRLRFLDSDGHVILNGELTSTRTCAHDLAAFTIHADTQGVFSLTRFGYQDETQELRFLAPGFLGIKYFDSDMLFLAPASQGEVLDIHVAQAPHPQIQLVDEDGHPISQTALHVLDSGDYMIARTDKQGRVRLPGRYSHGGVGFHRLKKFNNHFGESDGWMALVDEEFVLRENAQYWGDDEELGTVAVQLPNELPEDLSIGFDLRHDRGWADGIGERSEPAWEATFPAGQVHLGWGEPFGHLLPGHITFELEEGRRKAIEPPLEFASLLKFTRPDGVYRIWFEVNGSGTSNEYRDNSVWLPRGKPWRVGFDYHGQSLVFEQPPIDGPSSLDLATLLPESPESPAMSSVEVRFPIGMAFDTEDWPVPRVVDWNDDLPEPTATERGWIISGPVGRQMLARFYQEGKLNRWLRATFPSEAGATSIVDLAFVDAAQLQLELPEDWEVAESPIDLDGPLPPGPTEFVLIAPDGKRWGLVVVLQPGEERVIRIRMD
jgi:hypothetical protein